MNFIRISKLPVKAFLLCLLLQNQAHADFGCHFVVNARMASLLDYRDKKISYRFTCRRDITLTAVSLFCEEVKDPPGYMISLHADKKGTPEFDSLASATVVPGGKWFTVPFNSTPLSKGKVYHLVVEQDKNRGGEHPVGIIGPGNFASFAYTDIPNKIIPWDETPDTKAEVLLFENGSWRELHRQPLYALQGEGFQTQGNPYDLSGIFPIHGNGTPQDRNDDLVQGAALHPDCEIRPTGFAIRVKKQGNPTAALNYLVYTHDYMRNLTYFSFGGPALSPDQVSTSFKWVTIGFKREDNPIPFKAACTYIGFQTDSGQATTNDPGCENCYLISEVGNSGNLPMAAEMSFNGGPHLSRAAYSTDGGKTWIDRFEWDANLIILGPDCSHSLSPKLNPIPTPAPLPKALFP